MYEDSSFLKRINIPVLAMLALTVVAALLVIKDMIPKPQDRVTTVTATAKMLVKPDVAQLRVGVITQPQPTASQAVAKGNDLMNKVTTAIKQAGVKAENLQTTVYNLTPTYSYGTDGVQKLQGYNLYQELQVKVYQQDLDKISAILTAATTAGANQVGDIQFVIDNPDKIKQSAEDEAIKMAQAKAKHLEKVTHINLGKIIDIVEDQNNPQPQPLYSSYGMGGAPTDKAVAPSIEVGQNEISVTVGLVYEVE